MRKLTLLFLLLVISACCSNKELVLDRSLYEFRGKVTSGMMAIGGETTGTVLEATNGKTYELYMKNTGQLKRYNNKKVVLKGRVTEAQGVEVIKRNIIEVSEIKEE